MKRNASVKTLISAICLGKNHLLKLKIKGNEPKIYNCDRTAVTI